MRYLALFLAAGACGEGVHRADDLGSPITTIHGRLSGDLPDGVSSDSLRAAMIWAALPAEVEDCLDAAVTEEQIGLCMMNDNFVPGLAANDVAMEAVFPAAFEVPIHRLPDPAVLSGSPGARFGYGLLVVYADGNANGAIDLVPPEATSSADTVVASSFNDVELALVVYREGQLSSVWKMFDPIGCPEPPQGLSIVLATIGATGPVTCAVHAADAATIELTFDDSPETRDLICLPTANQSSYPSAPPPAGSVIECTEPGTALFYHDPALYCRNEQFLALAGCDYSCDAPEWNLTDAPPAWWPCTLGGGFASLSITDDPAPLTSGSDALFTLFYEAGENVFEIVDIELWVEESPSHYTALASPYFLTHIDPDGDGAFSPGDSLVAAEPDGLSLYDASYEGRTLDVELRDNDVKFGTADWQP